MNLNCKAEGKNMKTASMSYDPFTFQQFYEVLNDELVLNILLYLREKNPNVSLNDLIELTGKTESEVRKILTLLVYRQVIDEVALGEYNLNPRARSILNALLAQ